VPPHCPQCVCVAPGEEVVVVAGFEVVVGEDLVVETEEVEDLVVETVEEVEDLVVETVVEVEEEDGPGPEPPLPAPSKVDPISPQRILEYVT
jgi:hypothetical protein